MLASLPGLPATLAMPTIVVQSLVSAYTTRVSTPALTEVSKINFMGWLTR